MKLKVKCYECEQAFDEDEVVRTGKKYFDEDLGVYKGIIYCPECYAYELEMQGNSRHR